jgi:hypothetical protein
MNREFRYVVPPLGESEFPEIRKGEGAILSCEVRAGNEVCIIGNTDGLMYLAKYLAAMALIEKHNGLHVHLDPESGELEAGSSLLTVCNLDFGTKGGA